MSIPVYYAPALHPQTLSLQLPERVAFFPCGLPEPSPENGASTLSQAAAQARDAALRALPLDPRDAQSALDGMLAMGEEYASGGLLKELAAQRLLMENDAASWTGKPGEFDDLALFAKTGKAPGEAPVAATDWNAAAQQARIAAEAVRQSLIECQKVLLLAHSLEKRQLELRRLEARYRRIEASLASALGEGKADGEGNGETSEDVLPHAGKRGSGSLSWRVIVDAALPFLPANGVLFTADAAMAEDLLEAGMLQPFPEDRAAVCEGWPQRLVTGMLYASLPAWRLVGRSRPLAARPWLERDVEVFAARPEKGWLRRTGE